ncbi:MAG: TetR/AcrR family transcriptional regulator [Microthrixaceae bacterium]|nr:TetR/AcrR family transcriptional regulator [Microthrixaceae bacterium]MCO5321569.1 TetR/AcrR family transcriptional regulator [Microthrixaceae bacterium]
MTTRQIAGEGTRAVDGRVPGQRGLATRQKLLAQTRAMLIDTSYRDLKVVDIARGAGTSPATFYQYFADAESALLAIADELVAEGRDRLTRPVLEGDWSPGVAAYETCENIAAAFLAFWDDHGSLLAVIDLAALEGDSRFRTIRTDMLNAFTEAIGDVARAKRAEGHLPEDLDPTATASVLVAMLAHVSGHRYGIEAYGASTDSIRRSMARLLFSGLTGAPPPQ